MTVADAELIGTGEPWTRVHRRIHDHPGLIVDLGCAGWDWCGRFLGRSRVLAVDPFLDRNEVVLAGIHNLPVSQMPGLQLYAGVISSTYGKALVSTNGHASTTRLARDGSGSWVDVESRPLSDLLECYVDERNVAALKLNVEGAELEILMTLPEPWFARIDQIAVSFHDFCGLGNGNATAAVVGYLSNYYEATLIDARWSWYLFTKRR